MLSFHEFDTLLFLEPRFFHDLSISVSKIRTRDLIIISNSSRSYQRDEEKFTPIQFISRSSNKEPRRCIALYLENVFIVGYVGKKKKKKTRKSNRCRVATAPRSVSGCILSPRREQYNILSRGNREAKTKHNFVKLRTHGSDVYARCISKCIQLLRFAQCRIPIENQRFDSAAQRAAVRVVPLEPRFYLIRLMARSAPEAAR